MDWRKEYFVAPLKGFKQALEAGNRQVRRSKRMEVPSGKFVFPLLDDEAYQPPPRLDDQDCYHHDDPVDAFEGLFNDYPRSSHDEAGQGGGEEPDGEIPIDGMTMRDLFGDDDEEEELIPAEPEPRPLETTDSTMHGEPSSSSRGPRVPHDQTRMPDGEPVPPGFRMCLLLRTVGSGAAVNMRLVQQVAVRILGATFAVKCSLAAVDMIDEGKSFVPFGFSSKRFHEDVCHLLIKLLLQPSERNSLSAICVSHFLTVAFGDAGDCGLIVFKKLNLELVREVDI